MKISAIDYVTEDAAGNEIARTTGKVYTVGSADDLETLFAAAAAEMECGTDPYEINA